nr:helix-turn-helix transcriptional regulator [uncultured Schaedlerella sp.]
MNLGEIIRSLRDTNGITQKELADKLSISPSTIGMYEQGRREPDTTTLTHIATYFSVPTDYLLGVGVFENWDILLKNKTIITHQISKQAQQLSLNIKDGIDDISFAKLVYAFDIHIVIHEDKTIGISAKDPIPTYTRNYFSNTPSVTDAEKELLSLYRMSTPEEKREVIDLLNSFCALKDKRDRTKVLAKCYELEDFQSSVAADDLGETGTESPK